MYTLYFKQTFCYKHVLVFFRYQMFLMHLRLQGMKYLYTQWKKNSNIKSLHLTVRALLTLHMFLMHDSFIDHLIRGTRANYLKYLSESIIMEKFMENFSGFISHMFCDVYCTSSCIFSNDRTCHDSPLFQW